MFDSLSIQNFRGFQDLKISPLQRVNLFAGENNVGKTNILEAIYTLFADGELLRRLPSTFRPCQAKQDDREDFWLWLFFQRNYENRVVIAASTGGAVQFSLAIDLVHNIPPSLLVSGPPPKSPAPLHSRGFFFTYKYRGGMFHQFGAARPSDGFNHHAESANPLPSPAVAVFSTSPSNPAKDALEHNRIVAEGRENEIEELLRVVEPRLNKLRSLQVDSRGAQRQEPVLYADIGLKHLIPVTQLGQGFNRLLTIFLAILRSDAKILLVDEIENGLHYSAQKAVWKGLAEAARRADIQVFTTTHSWGCIVAAHEAFAESEQYDFAIHRVQRVKGSIESVTYDRKMLESSLETELEVR